MASRNIIQLHILATNEYEFYGSPAALYDRHTPNELLITQKSLNNYYSRCSEDSRVYRNSVIAKRSQKRNWNVTVDNKSFSHDRILRVSLDKFYEIVFGENDAFFKLCKVLPSILDDVISEDKTAMLQNTVYEELDKTDFLKSLYLLAFKTYEGFENF